MQTNIGSLDRFLRIAAGLAIVAVGVAYHSWWGALGALPILTALAGRCPAYALCGLSTHGRRKEAHR